MKRTFLMLAHTLEHPKDWVGGWWWSEKLDGQRCFWDGGVTRGLFKSDVPWANCAKDARYKEAQIATGLWSRYGNVIHAPDWFLDELPRIPLDGELWSFDKIFRQEIASIIKKQVPSELGWQKISYMVFDSPPPMTVFRNGNIDTTNFKKCLSGIDCWLASKDYYGNLIWYAKADTPYSTVYMKLQEFCEKSIRVITLVRQHTLTYPQQDAIREINAYLEHVVEDGGEGLIVRNPGKTYECCRSHSLLKVKKYDDMEGTVIGYITGRETELGSKLLGLMGALILRLPNGKQMELSGFTDLERFLGGSSKDGEYACDWATHHPATECPDWISSPAFPRGSIVTFKYRGLSKDGIPQEARYMRKRDEA